MKILDLCSGIGGFSLAAHWAGMETAAFCETDKFCSKVLKKNFPGVINFYDIKKFAARLKKGNKLWRFQQVHGAISIICGGIPCQDFSLAGERAGQSGHRWLWPDMFSIVQSLKPDWVVLENVIGFISLALSTVLSDLASEGYQVQTFNIPAAGIGANHERKRIWVVANRIGSCGRNDQRGRDRDQGEDSLRQEDRQKGTDPSSGQSEVITHSNSSREQQQAWDNSESGGWIGDSGQEIIANPLGFDGGLQTPGEQSEQQKESSGPCQKGPDRNPDSSRRKKQHTATFPGTEGLCAWRSDPTGKQWEIKPEFCGMDDGLSARLDKSIVYPVSPTIPMNVKLKNYQARINSLGNSIIPQIAYQILFWIKQSYIEFAK